jgi:L-ascorbate metabolism protein UlaG (beta-lactamase superfamily)
MAHTIEPWRGGITVRDVFVRAVPAYTLNKAYHAREFGGLGFLISTMQHDIYFAGDTDLIPEMERIGCDIALLPVGGAFTMNYEEAAKAVRSLAPRYAIPMHYGVEIPGSKDDGRRFCQLVNGGTEAIELPIENQKLKI